MDKLLDVLIPYYKGDLNLLKRLLDSIKTQVAIDFNLLSVIIFIDDYYDYTLDTEIKKTNYPFNIIIQRQNHSGISGNRNKLLKAGRAPYIIFCDQDDYFSTNNAFKKYFEVIDKETPDIIIAPIAYINVKDKVTVLSPDINSINGTLLHGRIFKRTFIEENNLIFLSCLDGMEDYYFVNLALQLSNKTVYIKGVPLYCWDVKPSSVTGSQGEFWFVNNFYKLIRGSSLIVREFLERDILESASITTTIFLATAFKVLETDSKFSRDIKIQNKIKVDLYSYLVEFEHLLNKLNDDKLTRLYKFMSVNYKMTPELLNKKCKDLKIYVENLPEFKVKNSFSIVIPTHDRKEMLVKAIQSIVNQQYSNYEIIVSDDRSSYDVKKHLKKYFKELFDSKMLTCVKSEGSGAAKTRNTALKLAKNDWIIYLDDDNTQFCNFLNTFNYAINSYPNIKCFFGRWLNKNIKQKYLAFTEFDWESLLQSNYIDLGVFVHSRDLYNKYSGFNESLSALEDWELILRYTKEESVKALDELVLNYNDGEHDRITTSQKTDFNTRKVRQLITKSEVPTVTTLVITYNQENYIREALDSVINQEGYFNNHILISDDCSSDKTPEIIKEYIEKYPDLISDISPKEHLGFSKNYWHAISHLNTKYVAFLEGDDYWLPDKLHFCIARLEDNPELKLVFTAINLKHENDENEKEFREGNPSLVLTDKDLINCSGNNFFINLSSCVVDVDILKAFAEAEGTDVMFSEIPLQFFITAQGNKLGRISEIYSVYRIHDAGVWSGLDRNHKDRMFYDCRRDAFEIASVEGKKQLYKILKERQPRLIRNEMITQEEINILDEEYNKLEK